jgi:hypothetical protein
LLCTNSLSDRLSDATREAPITVVIMVLPVVLALALASVPFEQLADRTETLVCLHRVALIALYKIQHVVLPLSGVIEQLTESVGFRHFRGHVGWKWQPSD